MLVPRYCQARVLLIDRSKERTWSPIHLNTMLRGSNTSLTRLKFFLSSFAKPTWPSSFSYSLILISLIPASMAPRHATPEQTYSFWPITPMSSSNPLPPQDLHSFVCPGVQSLVQLLDTDPLPIPTHRDQEYGKCSSGRVRVGLKIARGPT